MQLHKTSVVLLALMLAVMVAVPCVSAADIALPATLSGIADTPDPYTVVLSGKTDDKESAVAAMNNFASEKRLTGIETRATASSLSDSDYTSMNIYDSYIAEQSDISGTLDGGWVTPYQKYASGTLQAAWLGYSPYYADRITLGSLVSASGLGVAISTPFGCMGYEDIGGNTFSYSAYWTTVYSVSHSYSNFLAESWLDIPQIQESDSSTFRFGTSDYSLNTYVNI